MKLIIGDYVVQCSENFSTFIRKISRYPDKEKRQENLIHYELKNNAKTFDFAYVFVHLLTVINLSEIL